MAWPRCNKHVKVHKQEWCTGIHQWRISATSHGWNCKYINTSWSFCDRLSHAYLNNVRGVATWHFMNLKFLQIVLSKWYFLNHISRKWINFIRNWYLVVLNAEISFMNDFNHSFPSHKKSSFQTFDSKKYPSILNAFFHSSPTWWIEEGLCWFMIQILQTENRFHGPLKTHPAPKPWFSKESIAIIFPLLSLGLHFLRL